MIVRLKGNADIETESAEGGPGREGRRGSGDRGATLTVTGAPVLLKDINDYLRGGMLQLGALATDDDGDPAGALRRALAAAAARGDPARRRWAFGLAGYLGIPLSLVTIAGLPVMLGMGIDYAIQMHARVEEEVIIDRATHPIQETARNLGPALLIVTFTPCSPSPRCPVRPRCR
jgi:uncharacterized protein